MIRGMCLNTSAVHEYAVQGSEFPIHVSCVEKPVGQAITTEIGGLRQERVERSCPPVKEKLGLDLRRRTV
jgi:hypothetical protein